ncbi:hypothetical protein OH77DRAFT_1432625 [Trametes cingulata]|nr:hypothetical protein OH77DRAFT_1432625 [Trametes cingulata]
MSTTMSYTTLLQRIQKGLSVVELIHMSHPRWLFLPTAPPTLHISVLDSSFNPPTLAHLALANALPPPPADVPPGSQPDDFDARLLLLSVRNADKQLKPGDATYEQHMEMMVLLAHDPCARTRRPRRQSRVARPGRVGPTRAKRRRRHHRRADIRREVCHPARVPHQAHRRAPRSCPSHCCFPLRPSSVAQAHVPHGHRYHCTPLHAPTP